MGEMRNWKAHADMVAQLYREKIASRVWFFELWHPSPLNNGNISWFNKYVYLFLMKMTQ